ncbi:unnamed protein product [Ceutorhynchus assimilis]|uniref:Phosphatidylinositol-glycan biosynthesis class W protein n=1 Tax=Ceutorhynchus assimilis TaxID=467358 RepID=A0A9N9MR54_9CUCU|nr:unnamed protein product [Ceutorhynchus assimilis]
MEFHPAEIPSNILNHTTNNAQNATETILLVLPSFFYMIIAVLLSTLLLPLQSKTSIFFAEFVVIVIPIILNVTILSPYVTNVVIISCFILGMHLIISLVYIYCKRKKSIKAPKSITSNKKDYITNVRATINLISVIAILAVDFKVFPSKYSKTHLTGFSLMDVGVGLYVFANAIVAPEVKGKKDSIQNSIRGSAILIIIGLLRLVSTKLTHYKVSSSEYGVHWNFFITLAFTKIFSSCILNVINVKYIFLNASMLTFAHETLLQMSFKQWVFQSDIRNNFLDANKEGIVSTIGYVALYLHSVYFAYVIKQQEKNYRKASVKFFLSTAITLTLTFFCNQHFQVSRRLANAGYIFWILFIGILMTWLFYLAENAEKYLFRHKLRHYVCSPYLYEAVNYNGLVFFLVGNVLTGFVNLSTNTKLVSNANALLILVVYMLINCGVVFGLYLKEWKLKF